MAPAAKTLTYQAFVNYFAKGKLDRFYHIYGTEEYLKRKVSDMIVDRALPVDVRDFDLVIFYGDDCDIADVLDAVSTEPFLAEDKVVIIRKFDSLRPTIQQKLVDFLSQNEVYNIVLLLSEKIDNRLKIAKQMNKLGTVVHCRSPYNASDMIPWLKGEIGARGKTIEEDAALLFVSKVELDYMTAASELEKLLLFTIDSQRISASDVQISTGHSRSYNVFDLLNAVGEKDKQTTFSITENLLENKEAAVFLITMLLRFFVQLWRINALRRKGISDPEIESKYLPEIFHMFRRNYLKAAKNYPLSTMQKIFSILLESDTELKSVNIEDNLIVERMLFRIFSVKSQ